MWITQDVVEVLEFILKEAQSRIEVKTEDQGFLDYLFSNIKLKQKLKTKG